MYLEALDGVHGVGHFILDVDPVARGADVRVGGAGAEPATVT